MKNQTTEMIETAGSESRAQRRRKWEGEVAAFRQSGRSLAGYCRERNVHPWQLCYWRKALAGTGAPGGFEELPARPRSTSRPVLLPASAAELRVEANGCLLHIPDGVSAKRLADVLSAVRAL